MSKNVQDILNLIKENNIKIKYMLLMMNMALYIIIMK